MRTAILIVGSLRWDPRPKRESWRQSRLIIEQGVHVVVPIRYGRRSKNKTYTMTFANDGEMGRGLLVPCKADVRNTAELVAEAEELWMAEQPDTEPTRIGASWGCVGVLFSEQALQGGPVWCWMKHFQSKAVPVPPVDSDGLLSIRWPTAPATAAPMQI